MATSEISSRTIKYMPLSEIKSNPKNPKSHDLHTINASIDRFGVLDPIVLDGRTKQIISGHGRKDTLEGMEAAGDTPPEGVQLADDGTWLVPVATGWASKNDHEATAALIAMNRTTELGGWDDDALIELLDELSEMGDFTGVGYDETDLDDLQHELDNYDLENVPDSDNYAEKWELVIECTSEDDQEKKYGQLVKAGFSPKALAL